MASIVDSLVDKAHHEFSDAPYSLAKEPKENVTVTIEPTHQAVSNKPGFKVQGLSKNDPRREKTT